ncbi:MAG: hypothetical protein JO053_01585 [Acidobacteria bacterium]|nr:hypothetical protein [Acidobacteriota bacterium]
MNWFRIVGVLAALWGAGVLISWVLRPRSGATGAGAAGEYTGLVLGLLLLGAGLYAAVTGGRKPKETALPEIDSKK